MIPIDQPSETEWCTERSRALSRSSNRASSARNSGTSRVLIVPHSASAYSSPMILSLDLPVSGDRSLTSSGTWHGGSTIW
jgi:hypothetical protein